MSKYKIGYSWERKGIESTIVSIIRNEENTDYAECLVKERRPNESNDGMETFYVHQQFYDEPLYDVVMADKSSGHFVKVYKFNSTPLAMEEAQLILKSALQKDLYDEDMIIKIIEHREED